MTKVKIKPKTGKAITNRRLALSVTLAAILVIMIVYASISWGVSASASQEPLCFGTLPSDGLTRAVYVDYTAEQYLAQVASKSEYIVMGTISGIANTTVTSDGLVYTNYLLTPSVYLKGQPLGDEIVITRLGGSCGAYQVQVFDDLEVKPGEQYVLFLSNRTGNIAIAYGWQGVYPVVNGTIYSMLSADKGGPDIPSSRIVHGWSLEQFKAEIEKPLVVKTLTQTVTETRIVVTNGTSSTGTVTSVTTIVVTTTATRTIDNAVNTAR